MFSAKTNMFNHGTYVLVVLIFIGILANGQPIELQQTDKAATAVVSDVKNNELPITVTIQATDIVTTELPNQGGSNLPSLSIETLTEISNLNLTNAIDQNVVTSKVDSAAQSAKSLDLMKKIASEKVKKGLSGLFLQWNKMPLSQNAANQDKVAESSVTPDAVNDDDDQTIIILSADSPEFPKSNKRRVPVMRYVARPLRWG